MRLYVVACGKMSSLSSLFCVSYNLVYHRPVPNVNANTDQTPPKRELKVSDPKVRDLSLYELHLAPSSIIHLKFLEESLNRMHAYILYYGQTLIVV